MRLSRTSKLLIEPPSAATGDIAFNLIVFFLVCASVQPDTGRRQSIPSSETVAEESKQAENIQVALTRTAVLVNGDVTPANKLLPRLKSLLAMDDYDPDEGAAFINDVMTEDDAKDPYLRSYQHFGKPA